jgi:hypothetical protein
VSILNLNGPSGRSARSPRVVKVWVGIGLLVAVLGIGSTLAANITINGGPSTEFGQGVQRTVYCGSGASYPITVTPISSYSNPAPEEIAQASQASQSEDPNASASTAAGSFYLSGIQVSDIDRACSGINFVVSVYDNKGNDTPLPIVTTVSGNPALTVPAVYWIDGCPSFLHPEQCTAANISSITSGALLSADRTRYLGASPYATVTSGTFSGGSKGFTINFPATSGTRITSDSVGKIVIETQNDTFGLDELTSGGKTLS